MQDDDNRPRPESANCWQVFEYRSPCSGVGGVMHPINESDRDGRSPVSRARWVGSHAGATVTVITPSLNQRQFIGDCLESVARQDCGPLEHVIVDADSTDGTVDVVRGWRAHRIRL